MYSTSTNRIDVVHLVIEHIRSRLPDWTVTGSTDLATVASLDVYPAVVVEHTDDVPGPALFSPGAKQMIREQIVTTVIVKEAEQYDKELLYSRDKMIQLREKHADLVEVVHGFQPTTLHEPFLRVSGELLDLIETDQGATPLFTEQSSLASWRDTWSTGYLQQTVQ